ncbi:MAG TPA: hypothetical protein VN796_12110 [Acidimicrobiales bacterium]|nr:hypothetical protein [Acidimicrobiales bacterium]
MAAPNQVTRTLEDVRGQRYGEVFVVKSDDEGLVAEVYNSFTLNDCPQELWDRLDLVEIARSEGALAAVANGPRYWLVDTIEKSGPPIPEVRDFGGILMARAAILHLGAAGFDPSPYAGRRVARAAVFAFAAGSVVYELTDPVGADYVMQSWCTSVDTGLAEPDLNVLGDRLSLPAGWTYRHRKLEKALSVMTTTRDAVVLQDDLKNSYCLVT